MKRERERESFCDNFAKISLCLFEGNKQLQRSPKTCFCEIISALVFVRNRLKPSLLSYRLLQTRGNSSELCCFSLIPHVDFFCWRTIIPGCTAWTWLKSMWQQFSRFSDKEGKIYFSKSCRTSSPFNEQLKNFIIHHEKKTKVNFAKTGRSGSLQFPSKCVGSISFTFNQTKGWSRASYMI